MGKTSLVGVDIGGTKCAICFGREEEEQMHLLAQRRFPTPSTPEETLVRLGEAIGELSREHGAPAAIGVSCGGPLDSERGVVYAPPNLPGWERVDVLTPLRERFEVPVSLRNDADAGVLAEWLWGAGRGCRNIIFLTFGTGMGAGLILDGRLYRGTSNLAGEVGHVRLAESGPVGYGKAGSFEGFCGGGGIARLARALACERLAAGERAGYCSSIEELEQVTAESVGRAAQEGDPTALLVWEIVARRLGQGLALLIDVLNPERILLGSIYLRQRALLESLMLSVLREEALPAALAACQVLPAGLGEQIGDYASLAVARQVLVP